MGVRCHFAHGKDEMRQISDVSEFYIFFTKFIKKPLPTTVMMNEPKKQVPMATVGVTGGGGYPMADNYKTVKCRFFELGINLEKSCYFKSFLDYRKLQIW